MKHKDKARWVAAEEAAIIVTLLLQKAVGNSFLRSCECPLTRYLAITLDVTGRGP